MPLAISHPTPITIDTPVINYNIIFVHVRYGSKTNNNNNNTQTDCHLIPSDFNVIGIDYGCIFRDLNFNHVSAYFMQWIALCVYWTRWPCC